MACSFAKAYAETTRAFSINNDMKHLLELTKEERNRVAEIDAALSSCSGAIQRHDRGARRETLDKLQAQSADLSNLDDAIVKASSRRPDLTAGLPYGYAVVRNSNAPFYTRIPSEAEAKALEPDWDN